LYFVLRRQETEEMSGTEKHYGLTFDKHYHQRQNRNHATQQNYSLLYLHDQ